MIRLRNQNFSLYKILLLAIGLWPYHQTKFTQLQFILFFIILMAGIIFQLTTFITSKCTLNFVLKILSTTLVTTIFVITYSSFRVNMETVKDLLAQLQQTCDELKDENEIDIIEKYSCHAKRYTIIFTTIASCSIIVLIINQFGPYILDVILATNESRSHQIQVTMEYFIDQEKYFFFILLHINVVACIGAVAIIATGSLFICYFQHTCGMFKIASYRIKHAMQINISHNVDMENKNLISKRIICAVYMHRQAMKLCDLFVSRFEIPFLCLMVVGVGSLSLNLFRIFQVVSFENDIKEFLLPMLFVLIIILYMFLANYVGQDVMDHNNHVFTTAYSVQWYAASLHTQKLILFLLQRGRKDFTLTIGGLFVASVECFAMLVKASVSYFTVIYSTR